MDNKPLKGKVAVVAGATRGAGRAIAVSLGEAGATVYVTGRSVRGNPSPMGRLETIEETAELIHSRGGTGIVVRVDHTIEDEVKSLFERIKREQAGRLDILVNDVWGGDYLTEWGKAAWEHSLQKGFLMQQSAVHSHIITCHYGVPLMVERGEGLVIEITDGVDYHYRESLFYSLAKISTIHIAEALADDFRKRNINITSVALTPGFMRSEVVLEDFRVSEENWRDGIGKDPHFAKSETPYFIGRAVVALASDPNLAEKAGKTLSSGRLAREYGFTDLDGTQPSWY